jgi:phytoene dehydrogenase-like protein
VGGAAVTEEIIPGFKFSRASYVLSLLRPFIISDLKLKDFGLKFHLREPFSSYTPIKESLWSESKARRSLLLGSDLKLTCEEISKFSRKDATAYEKYEEEMGRFVEAVVTLLDSRPPHLTNKSSLITKLKGLGPLIK